MSVPRNTHAAVTAATVAAVAAVLVGTIALAATATPIGPESPRKIQTTKSLGFVQQLAPPPGAAALAIAGLLALRRKRR